MSYVCQSIEFDPFSNTQTCTSWVEFVPPSSPWDELNNLSQAEATALLTQTVVLWAVAWGWNFLSNFANR